MIAEREELPVGHDDVEVGPAAVVEPQPDRLRRLLRYCSVIRSSTRRFWARPSTVVLFAIGSDSP